MSRYLAFTRSAYYAVVAAIPLLLAYEILLLAAGGVRGMQVRNAADVWLRMVLESLGVNPHQATLAMLLVLILSVPLLRHQQSARLEPRYLAGMLAEAAVYSLVLGILIQLILALLFSTFTALPGGLARHAAAVVPLPLAAPSGRAVLQGMALSAGAGLFEEFVFRVVLLNALLTVTRLVLAEWLGAVVAILAAAGLFSLAHYVGPLGEGFQLHSFLFRWMAGLLFTVLYYLRGFAVTAYAHALYDLRILLWTM